MSTSASLVVRRLAMRFHEFYDGETVTLLELENYVSYFLTEQRGNWSAYRDELTDYLRSELAGAAA